jgi:hypothetical protein
MATSTSSADIKSVKVPTFDGKRDSFQVWWLRFQAFSKAYKFRSAIDDTKEPDLPDTGAPQQGDTTAQVEARERNSTAFDSGESMKFIYKGFTKDYPNGLAYLVIKALMKKFKPQDATSNLEFTQALMVFITRQSFFQNCMAAWHVPYNVRFRSNTTFPG